jgi:transaldolase
VELVAPGTVNTMPEATLEAVADHGTARGDTVTGSYSSAQQVLDDLASTGVDYDDVVRLLEQEGLEKFEDAWTELLSGVSEQLEAAGSAERGGGGSAGAA